MKKSEMYREAQRAVVNMLNIPADDKLEILRQLAKDEELAIFVEEREAAENGKL